MTSRPTVTSLDDRLAQGFRLPHEAASAGVSVHALVAAADGSPQDPELLALVERYLSAVRDADLQDVCRTQAAYALTLASDEDLLDEERMKVLSLCDEVEALVALGLPFEPAEHESFVEQMTSLLSTSRGPYTALARHRDDPTRRDHWHMRLLVG